MEIKVLIENTTDSELLCEHGLSLFINCNGKSYLLDAGTTGMFLRNAKNMNVDLSEIECAVLSHGHYDHAGGFKALFEKYGDKKVYAMKSVMEAYYSGSGGNIHEIGIPQDIIMKYKDNFILIDEITKLDEGVYIVPHNVDNLEKIGEKAKLYKMVEGRLVPDDFSHELSLLFDTDKGLVIFNSCSHAGIVNIIKEIKEICPDKKIHVFFGGLHMKGKRGDEVICTFTEEEVKEIADYLNDADLDKLYTGHCTGEQAIRLLKKYLGEKLEVLSTGKRICI